jgi:hypothetical protein
MIYPRELPQDTYMGGYRYDPKMNISKITKGIKTVFSYGDPFLEKHDDGYKIFIKHGEINLYVIIGNQQKDIVELYLVSYGNQNLADYFSEKLMNEVLYGTTTNQNELRKIYLEEQEELCKGTDVIETVSLKTKEIFGTDFLYEYSDYSEIE